MAKNLQAKTRNLSKGEKPYEVWVGRGWRWEVLKKWQADDSKPYARWFCRVVSPMMPSGELGDVYVADIKSVAILIQREGFTISDSVIATPKDGDFSHTFQGTVIGFRNDLISVADMDGNVFECFASQLETTE